MNYFGPPPPFLQTAKVLISYVFLPLEWRMEANFSETRALNSEKSRRVPKWSDKLALVALLPFLLNICLENVNFWWDLIFESNSSGYFQWRFWTHSYQMFCRRR